jgi:mono/diheme cytochrome c family protein
MAIMRKNITILIVFALVFSFTSKLFAQEAEWNKWVAPKSANDMRNPFKGDPSATAQGKKMFRGMCVLCHGMKGDGKGGGGVSLNPKPANFLALSVSDQTDGALFWKLTEGKPPMASYKDLLSEDQRWKLISYIRTLEKNN